MPKALVGPSMLHDHVPPWLDDLLNQAAVSPTTTAVWSGGEDAGRIGGPVATKIAQRLKQFLRDKLGTTFEPRGGEGVPQRVRLTGFNPQNAAVKLADTASGAPLAATGPQFDQLLNSGHLLPGDTVPSEGLPVSQLQSRLRALLDDLGPEYKAQQVTRALRKPHTK